MRMISAFTVALISSTAIFTAPVKADAQLEELKARLERAQKENLLLKAEKVEKENLTIKAEALEAENAAMRNEGKATKTAASIPQRFEPSKPQPRIVAKQSQDNESARPRKLSSTFMAVDKAIAAIPKNDERRELVAVSKAAFDPKPINQWQGVYVGINAGYAANDVNIYSTAIGNGPNTSGFISGTAAPIIGGGATTTYFGGPVVGGQFGYNYEFANHIIVGFETDLDYTDINNNHINNTPSWGYTLASGSTSISSTGQRTGLNWLGTTRLRLGYSLGKFLPYITGGLAYGELTTDGVNTTGIGYSYYFSPTNYNNTYFGSMSAAKSSSVNLGWALGAGAEYFVADNWSLKGEYIYTQLSGLSGQAVSSLAYSSNGSNSSSSTSGPLYVNTTMGAFGIHQARVGLNYHTGWLGSSPTVVAKY